MLRHLTRLILLLALGFLASGEASALTDMRAPQAGLAGQKTASGIFSETLAILRHPGASQPAESQQEKTGRGYDFAPGSSLAAEKTPIWSSTKKLTPVENAFGHWKKHGVEFPEFQNAKQYAEGAKRFVTDPPKGTLTKPGPRSGDTLFYHPETNTFGVRGADGAPRTMFRPTDGIEYWKRQ